MHSDRTVQIPLTKTVPHQLCALTLGHPYYPSGNGTVLSYKDGPNHHLKYRNYQLCLLQLKKSNK